jgi:GH43 family beta-xylosidase
MPESPPTFTNPLRCAAPDPFVTFWKDHYYLAFTRHDHISLVKALRLEGLARSPEVVVWQDDTPSRSCNMWAPELYFLEGRWYLYYTADDGSLNEAGLPVNHRMHVLESAGNDPLGPYTYKAKLYTYEDDEYAIDGTVYRHLDGKLYYFWSGGPFTSDHLYVAPLVNPWTLGARRVQLAEVCFDWERQGGLSIIEAPAILHRGGTTFLVYSGSATWSPDYALGLLVHKGGDLLDPATWHRLEKPVFRRSDAHGIYGPGHCSFFTSPNGKEDWIVYHAMTTLSGDMSARHACAQPFNWKDGLPDFGTPVPHREAIPEPARG